PNTYGFASVTTSFTQPSSLISLALLIQFFLFHNSIAVNGTVLMNEKLLVTQLKYCH
ncbi:hypothetical protein MKW98_015048, partial [Papaver atlanticum]